MKGRKGVIFSLIVSVLGIPGGSVGKESTCQNLGDAGLIPWRRARQPNSSIFVWRSSLTEESDGLQPPGSQRAGHD